MLNTFLLKKKGFTDEEIAEAIMSVDLAEKSDCVCMGTDECKHTVQINDNNGED
jgi:hypothetical protein